MGIKPYPTCDVTLSYQNFGSAWLGVLRGPREQVVRVFNGLYNLGATNGDCEHQDGTDVTLFWTSPRQLRKFFFYYFFNPRSSGWLRQGRLARHAMRYAVAKVALLRSTCHEHFCVRKASLPDIYVCGKITAERPDVDMKDAILEHAFATPTPAES